MLSVVLPASTELILVVGVDTVDDSSLWSTEVSLEGLVAEVAVVVRLETSELFSEVVSAVVAEVSVVDFSVNGQNVV